MVVHYAPHNLTGDAAYDSDKLDAELKPYAIELIAPHRSNRKNRTEGASTLPEALENREAVCLAAKLPTPRRPLRATCRELPQNHIARLSAAFERVYTAFARNVKIKVLIRVIIVSAYLLLYYEP